jgi:hypothetical protein
VEYRNYKTFGPSASPRAVAASLGRREYDRISWTLSQARQGFRGDNPKRRCASLRRPYPTPHTQARKKLDICALVLSHTLSVGGREPATHQLVAKGGALQTWPPDIAQQGALEAAREEEANLDRLLPWWS